MGELKTAGGDRREGSRAGAIIIQMIAILGLVASVIGPLFIEREFTTDWRILVVLALIALGADAPQVIEGLRVVLGRGNNGNGGSK